MNGVTGWVTNPSNLAQSFQNLWLTVNDMRNALDSLIDTTTPTTCSGIIYDVIATTVGSVGAITDINLNFNNSILPAGFTDCNPTGARIKITDDNRNSIESNVIISSFVSSSTGTNISISGLSASSSSYDVEVPFCFSNSAGSQCERIVNRVITATQPKPSISFTPGTTSITATLDASNLSSSDSVRIEMLNSKVQLTLINYILHLVYHLLHKQLVEHYHQVLHLLLMYMFYQRCCFKRIFS